MYTKDNLPKTWDEVPVGSEISEELYWEMLNMLPPLSLRHSPYRGFQSSEPHSHEVDDQGRVRSTHMTFVAVNGKFYYAGIQFGGECRWRLTA